MLDLNEFRDAKTYLKMYPDMHRQLCAAISALHVFEEDATIRNVLTELTYALERLERKADYFEMVVEKKDK